MVEAGKRLVVRGLVREVEQYFRLGYAAETAINLVAWSKDTVILPWTPGKEVPDAIFACKDSADGEALVRLLSDQADAKFIILTDGFWADDSQVDIERWRDAGGHDALRILRVGGDANPKLKGPDVFEAEQFFAAVDGWLLSS